MICEICALEIEAGTDRRSVGTPHGRKPVHARCHQKYLDMATRLLPPEPGELPTHIVIEPKTDPRRYTATEEEHMAGKDLTVWDEKFAEMQEQYAAGESVGGNFLSLKGGILQFQEEPLPGNMIVAVVLDAITERTYYREKYDANAEHNLPPICYAFGRASDEEELAPHPSMQADLSYFQPQNDICRTCPMNEWGSADTGRGKACGERRRLALLPAGYFTPRRGSRDFDMNLITDEHHFRTADIAFLKLPVTSVKNWAKYVTQQLSALRRPPMAVITLISVEQDANTQFKVKFEIVEQLKPELYDVIMKRHEEAVNSIVFGYPPPGQEAETPAPARSVRRR